ncbi:MAG TPA: tetratricopeptide repeat protein [Pyrinomonadaceae bacterium]|jgi:tetratricopeptide (TPR) repeat protein
MKKLTFILLLTLLSAFTAAAQTDVQSIAERAKNLFGSNEREKAFVELNKAIALEPDNPNLYVTRAEFYFALQNKKPEILRDAQKAASLAPTDKEILYRAALVLHRSQQFKEALKLVEERAALGNLDRRGWGLRIQIKTFLEDFYGAFEDASKAIELFPQDDYLKQVQANLIRLMGDSDKALEIYDALIASNEKKLALAKDENEKSSIKSALSLFLLNRARIILTKPQKEQAFADLIKVVEYQPEGFNYFHRGKLYREQKMYAEALADFNKILVDGKTGMDKSFVYLERANVYYETQKYREALADYEEAVKLNESMRQFVQNRIALIKQKTDETSQPK